MYERVRRGDTLVVGFRSAKDNRNNVVSVTCNVSSLSLDITQLERIDKVLLGDVIRTSRILGGEIEAIFFVHFLVTPSLAAWTSVCIIAASAVGVKLKRWCVNVA